MADDTEVFLDLLKTRLKKKEIRDQTIKQTQLKQQFQQADKMQRLSGIK